MFERFTPRARRVLFVAQEEAKNLNHSFIEPEHLLLALVQGDGVAAVALGQLGVSMEEVRSKVEGSVARAKTEMSGPKVPFSPLAKKALELSLREALQLGHNYIGTEHLVLGVLRVGKGDAWSNQLLGVDANEVRARVLEITTNSTAAESRRSPAVSDAMRLAQRFAGAAPMTTGQLLLALLTDGASQAGKALEVLGVTTDSLESQLAQIPIAGTSDARPRPRAVEIKLGDVITTIEDSDLAAALSDLSPERLQAALRDVLGAHPRPAGRVRGRKPS